MIISPATEELILAVSTTFFTSCSITSAEASPRDFDILNRYPAPNLLLRNNDDPLHLNLPSDMITIRSANVSASSMKCVVRSTTLPFLQRCNNSQVERRLYGSIPEVGSSKRTNFGSPTSAIDNDNFRFIPPDRADASTYLFSVNPTSLITLSTESCNRYPYNPLILPKNSRCSCTVKQGNNTLYCGHTPVIWRIAGKSPAKDLPYICTLPAVASTSPVSVEIVVVFPAPLCPSKQVI
mmetsp:Transcript_25722/g.35378  ORF Transcript_25722/g.35378 Transcript_25722/m.35378 type:complete len:238 (+) Transcript_25722:266-979(+)